MLFFLSDLLFSSFTNISSYLIILSWIPKKPLYFILEGIILTILTHNLIYLLILSIMYLINKISKIKVHNIPSFFYFFTYNYFIFNGLLWFINNGTSSLLFNYFYNLILTYTCYKLSLSIIKLPR